MYTIAKIIPTNSAPINMKRNVEFKKANTKNKTEFTGFFENITDKQVAIKNDENK